MQVRLFPLLCAEMSRLCAQLDMKGTIWSHVLKVHCAQFLQEWGTLFPFLGYGVEGRHRLLKKHLRLSPMGQWKGGVPGQGRVGLASVLEHDQVRFFLLRLGHHLPPRPGKEAYDATDTAALRLWLPTWEAQNALDLS